MREDDALPIEDERPSSGHTRTTLPLLASVRSNSSSSQVPPSQVRVSPVKLRRRQRVVPSNSLQLLLRRADIAHARGDAASAFDLYRLAADRGDARALFTVAAMTGKGDGERRPASIAGALKFARRAAAAGHLEAAVFR